MKKTVAVVVVVVGLGGAVYLGSLHLGPPASICSHRGGGVLDLLNCPASRAVWQLPVAVVIALLGMAGAVGVLKRT